MYQKWPHKIFPVANCVLSTMVTLVSGGGEGVLGKGPPPGFNYSKHALPLPPVARTTVKETRNIAFRSSDRGIVRMRPEKTQTPSICMMTYTPEQPDVWQQVAGQSSEPRKYHPPRPNRKKLDLGGRRGHGTTKRQSST